LEPREPEGARVTLVLSLRDDADATGPDMALSGEDAAMQVAANLGTGKT